MTAAAVGSALTLATRLLGACGMPAEAAGQTARAVVLAEAWGVRSHGLLRLPYYLRRLRAGGYRPDAELKSTMDTGPLVTLDGGGGLGHWQAWQAAELAAARAAGYGIAAVSVADSGHCGALGVHVLPSLRAGLVGMVVSNGPAVMPPWGGSAPVVSTSPIAFGVPAGDGHAIVDLASSAVSRGEIANRARTGLPLSEGWAFDVDGRPTVDAAAALAGMLAPLGGPKGFALAYAVEALTGGLVGPALSSEIVDPFSAEAAATPQRIAHLVVALDPARFGQDAPRRLAELATSVVAAGGRVPGGAREDLRDIPADRPLEVAEDVLADLREWARRLGVDFPRPANGKV